MPILVNPPHSQHRCMYANTLSLPEAFIQASTPIWEILKMTVYIPCSTTQLQYVIRIEVQYCYCKVLAGADSHSKALL